MGQKICSGLETALGLWHWKSWRWWWRLHEPVWMGWGELREEEAVIKAWKSWQEGRKANMATFPEATLDFCVWSAVWKALTSSSHGLLIRQTWGKAGSALRRMNPEGTLTGSFPKLLWVNNANTEFKNQLPECLHDWNSFDSYWKRNQNHFDRLLAYLKIKFSHWILSK